MDKLLSLSSYTKPLVHCPHPSIIKSIDKRTFPYASNQILGYWASYLAGKEFTSCSELLKKRFPYEYSLPTDKMFSKLMDDFMGIQTMIQDREKLVKNKLEQAAERITRNLFDIPDWINLKASIEDKHEIDIDSDFSQEKLTPRSDRIPYLSEQIQKRVILNSLAHGSSIYSFKSAHYIIKETIDKIDSQLFHLYNSYSALVNFNLWQLNPTAFMNNIEDMALLQGMCKLDIETKTIEASGINFVTMLTECIKGTIDLIISWGLPQDVSADELKYIYSKSDNHNHEMFYYYLSPTLWSDLIECLDVDTQELKFYIQKLSLMNYSDLTDIFNLIIKEPAKAKIKLSL